MSKEILEFRPVADGIPPRYEYKPLPPGKWVRLMQLSPGGFGDPLCCKLVEAPIEDQTTSEDGQTSSEDGQTTSEDGQTTSEDGQATSEDDQATTEDDIPTYHPISYFWGDPLDIVDITCDGRALSITRSLATCLKYLRDETETVVLWADGICINQKDRDEQGRQVGFMGEIYTNGSGTLIWFGEDSDGTVSRLFDLIPILNKLLETEWDHMDVTDYKSLSIQLLALKPISKGHPALGTFDPEDQDPQSVEKSNLSTPRTGGKKARRRMRSFIQPSEAQLLKEFHQKYRDVAEQFLKRPWFRRVWIHQEIGLSHEATAVCGGKRIPFSQIAQLLVVVSVAIELLPLINIHGDQTSNVFAAMQHIWAGYSKSGSWFSERPILQEFFSQEWRNEIYDFPGVLDIGRRFNSTDPRDHIFGFLGHAGAKVEPNSTIIKPDYKRSSDEIQRDFACSWLSNKSLNLFSYVQHNADLGWDSLPSWVPRWDQGYSRRTLPATHWPSTQYPEWQPANVDESWTIKFDGNRAMIRGVVLDSIAKFSGTLQAPLTVTKCGEWARECLDMCGAVYPDCYEEPEEKYDCVFYVSWVLVGGTYVRGPWLPDDFRHLLKLTAPGGDLKYTAWSTNWVIDALHPGYRFFLTKEGHYGLGPEVLQEGDVCVLVLGCRNRLLLRPTGAPAEYQLVGTCHIPTLSFVHQFGEGGKREEDMVLV